MSTRKEQPYISVVIPAFNEAGYLPRALESLSRQTYRDFEVIVADNGSTDATASIAEQYGARVVTEPNRGITPARQAGTLAARGQIVVSTDADATYSTGWLAGIADTFMKDAELVGVAGPVGFQNAPLWGMIFAWESFAFVRIWQALTGSTPVIWACNFAFRKSAWDGYNLIGVKADEGQLLRSIKSKGRVIYKHDNKVMSSSRRLRKGLLYNLVVSVGLYVLVDSLSSQTINKSVLSHYGKTWDARAQKATGWKIASFAIIMIAMLYSLEAHPAMAHAIAKRGPHLRHLHNIALHIDRDGRRF